MHPLNALAAQKPGVSLAARHHLERNPRSARGRDVGLAVANEGGGTQSIQLSSSICETHAALEPPEGVFVERSGDVDGHGHLAGAAVDQRPIEVECDRGQAGYRSSSS
jgi:hypothetical protein